MQAEGSILDFQFCEGGTVKNGNQFIDVFLFHHLCLILCNTCCNVAYQLQIAQLFIGNLDAEFFFQRHNQFYGIQRIDAQIVSDRSAFRNLCFITASVLTIVSFTFSKIIFISPCRVIL